MSSIEFAVTRLLFEQAGATKTESEETLMSQQPEIKTPADDKYAGMDLQEFPFAVLDNNYGQMETYCLDVISSPEKANAPRPVVIFVHGGGFLNHCNKRQGYIPTFSRALTSAGYVVISPDYPSFNSSVDRDAAGGFKIAADRAAAAVHAAYGYIQQHAEALNLDASRVAIMGGSAGGMTGFAAVANYEDDYRLFVNCWGSPPEPPSLAGFPPVLSIHGTEDQLLDYNLELPIQKQLEDLGIRHELITLVGAKHTPMSSFEAYIPTVLAYLEDTMK